MKKLNCEEITRDIRRKQAGKKLQTYRGWVIAWDAEGVYLQAFTGEEWAYGEGLRTPEFEDCGSVQECQDNIDSY